MAGDLEDPEIELDLPPPVKKPTTSPTHSSQHADTDQDATISHQDIHDV